MVAVVAARRGVSPQRRRLPAPMYIPHATGRVAVDDLLDFHFGELGLIEPVWNERRRYRFVLGQKPTLPPPVIVYSCLDYPRVGTDGRESARIGRLTYDVGSPGRAFKLTEEQLTVALELYAVDHGMIRITSAAGVPQLAYDEDPLTVASEVLASYYRDFDRHTTTLLLGSAASSMRPSLFESAELPPPLRLRRA